MQYSIRGSVSDRGDNVKYLKNARICVPGVFIAILLVTAVFSKVLAPLDPMEMHQDHTLKPPGAGFVLGTDEFGRDILSRIVAGSTLTVLVSGGAVAVGTISGTLLGLVAGYYGGVTDMIIMRACDVVLCFPPILLATFIVAFWGSSILNLILVLGLLQFPRNCRVTYSMTLYTKNMEFVEAARAQGASRLRIILRHVLPNIMAPIIVQASLGLGTTILTESGLSFLGLGPPPTVVTWGRMIMQSMRFMRLSPLVVVWPALVISLTVLSFNLLGDAIRDAVDPRLRQ
jgi:ABC-type dipeptide/oligopeptide/nickel transport system permease subunit